MRGWRRCCQLVRQQPAIRVTSASCETTGYFDFLPMLVEGSGVRIALKHKKGPFFVRIRLVYLWAYLKGTWM